MPWPNPAIILYVLGAFIVGYGLSLAVRAGRARRWRGVRESCPECAAAWPGAEAAFCGKCGARPPAASATRWAGAWTLFGVVVSLAGLGVFMLGLVVAEDLRDSLGLRGGPEIGPVLGGGLGLSLFGLYVAVVGYRGQAARGRRRCPKCWYLIDPALGLKCSECGHEATREKDLFRPRRRWRLAMLGLLLVLIGQLGWMESRVRSGGWLAAVPTEVLILGMPWVPEEWLVGSVTTTWRSDPWSLAGRVAPEFDFAASRRMPNPRSWAWHRPWAIERCAAWVLAARTSEEAATRLRVLYAMHSDHASFVGDHGSTRALLHALNLGIDGLAGGGKDPEAGRLLQAVREYGYPEFRWSQARHVSPRPEVAAAITARRDELVDAVLSGPAEFRSDAAATLILGEADESSIDAVLVALRNDSGVGRAMAEQVARDPAAAAILARVAFTPEHRDHALARSCLELGLGGVLALQDRYGPYLRSEEPYLCIEMADLIGRSGYDDWVDDAESRLFELLQHDPTLAPAIRNALGVRLGHLMWRRTDDLLRMARSGDVNLEMLIVWLALWRPPASPGLVLEREALRLVDAGVPLPPDGTAAKVERLRRRVLAASEEPASPRTSPGP